MLQHILKIRLVLSYVDRPIGISFYGVLNASASVFLTNTRIIQSHIIIPLIKNCMVAKKYLVIKIIFSKFWYLFVVLKLLRLSLLIFVIL